jgi:hypothetical protein
MTSYVLLCRHGRHRDGRLIPTKLDDGTDEYPPAAVGNRLKECLESAPGTGVCLNLVGVRCAPTDEAAETLWHLQTALRLEATAKGDDLSGGAIRTGNVKVEWSPELQANPSVVAGSVDVPAEAVRTQAVASDHAAVLVVGHQPLLSRLADSLLRAGWWRRVPPVPLDHSDIVCIAVGKETTPWLE